MSVGNFNIDITIVVDEYPPPDTTVFAREAWIGPGGSALNYAVAVTRLGHKASLVARTGEDVMKLGLLDELRHMGVDTGYIQIAKGEPPGTVVVITIPKHSQRTLLTVRGANDGLTGSIVPGGADHVHFASVKGRILIEADSVIKSSPGSSYDPGGEVVRNREGVLRAIPLVKTLFVNEVELGILARGVREIRYLFAGRLEMIVVKRGVDGVLIIEPDGELYVEAPRVEGVIDATGAGDAFDAAFNIGLRAGMDPETAASFASAAGAAKTLLKGSSNMPSLEQVLRVWRT